MAKQIKEFPKKSIKIPSGDDFITGMTTDLSHIATSMSTAFASFYLGSGSYGRNYGAFMSKAYANKRSILGKDSIYQLLEDIKTSLIKNNKVLDRNISTNINEIKDINKDFYNNFKELFNQKLIEGIIALSNNKIPEINTQSSDNDDLLKSLNTIVDSAISDNVSQPLFEISNKLTDVVNSYVEAVTQYSAISEKQLDIIKQKNENIAELKNAKIEVLLQGVENSTIEDLIEFSKQNTDNLVSNIGNIEKFFEALKTIKDIDINDKLTSISAISPVLLEINKLLNISKNLPDINNDTIKTIFGDLKNKDSQILNNIIILLNRLPDLKDQKQERIQKSLENLASIMMLMSTLLGDTIKNLSKMEKMSNDIVRINPNFIFDQIERIFGKIDNNQESQLQKIIQCINSLENIDENRVKTVGKTILGISEVFGMTLLMFNVLWPLSVMYNKTLSKVNFGNIFDKLRIIIIKTNTLPDVDNDKLKNIHDGIKGIIKTLGSIYLLALESKMINKAIGKEEYSFRVIKLIGGISVIFGSINENNKLVDITNKTNIIDSNIKALYKTLLYISALKGAGLASKLTIGTIKPLIWMFSEDNENGIHKLFETIQNSYKNVNINPILSNIQKVETIISTINKFKLDRNIQKKLDQIRYLFENPNQGGLFKTPSRSLRSSLPLLFQSIESLNLVGSKDKLSKIQEKMVLMIGIITSLNEIGKQKGIKNIQNNIDVYFDALEEFYKKVDEKFDKIIQTGAKVEQLKLANKSIKEGLDDCSEIAIKTNSNSKDINKGIISLEGLSSFMISAVIVMSIGALFVMLGGGKFVKAALEFGITLTTFELLVISPMLVFRNQENAAFGGLKDFSSFLISCTILMSVGALFMMLGGGEYIKQALSFGIVLSIFELLVISPFLIFYNQDNIAMKGLSEFSGFLITCTIIMSVGALFMSLAGGKFVKNALKFGLTLGLFETLVISPFILFGFIKETVFSNADSFIELVITCTTIMLVGALFMTLAGGELVKNALKFTSMLMLFEMSVIAPFLIMNMLKSETYNGMKLFSGIIISSTIVLMVGALFMKADGGKLWKYSLKFTALLMAFEIGVVTPLLMFNKISSNVGKGLVGFSAAVIVLTTTLMIGSLFMTMENGQMWKYATEFTVLLSVFTGAIGAIGVGLSKWLNEKALITMNNFATFMIISTVSLMIGAFFIKQYGSESVWEYGALLTAFIGINGRIVASLTKWLDGKALLEMHQFGVFIMLSSLSLITGAFFIKQYGSKSVLEYGILLTGFVTVNSIIISLINKFMNPKAIADMEMLGIFLLTATSSMAIGTIFIDKYGATSTLKFMGMLLLYIGEAGLIMAGLQVLAPFIALGIVTGAALGVALLTLSTSVMLINTMFLLDPHGTKTRQNIETLNQILGGGIKGTFALLGLLSLFIVPGAIAATSIGASMLILGASFTVINLLIGRHGKEIQENLDTLDSILGKLKWTYTKLGLLSPFIALGSISAVAIGVSMLALSSSLFVMNKMMHNLNPSNILNELLILGEIVAGFGVLSIGLIALTIPLGLAMPALGLMNMFSYGLSNSIDIINKSVQNISKEGDLTKKIDIAIANMKKFINIPSQIFDGNWLTTLKNMENVYKVKAFAIPMAQTMLISAMAIEGMASLKVPNKWDKDGNPIGYKKLNDADFESSVNNTRYLLTNMAYAFYETWNGKEGLKHLWSEDGKIIDNIVDFGIKSGKVINGVAEGIGNMAKMQIPIAWDENGHPIGYRQLKLKDFTLASKGVSTILTAMAKAINDTYSQGYILGTGKNVFDFDEFDDSPFSHTLEASLKMASLIGNIGSAVGNIAKMEIPYKWDPKTGKVSEYRTLNPQDFKAMGENVKTILTSIITCLADLYTQGYPNGDLNPFGQSGNIFDIVSGNLFSDDKPSKIEMVLGASMKVSELIGNIGKGIKDIATLQIPIAWDKKGHPIAYETLKTEDFTAAANSVATIVTTLVTELSKLDLDGAKVAGGIIEEIMPVNELVSGMADGIIKIAAGQIPNYDNKGNIIGYTKMNEAIYKDAGESIASIINALSNGLVNAATDENGINKIFTDGTFESISNSIGSMTGLVSSIVDSIIKIGSSQIPDQWDPKTGKPTHYKEIDIAAAEIGLTFTIDSVISAMSNAIINAYNSHKNDGLFTENPGSGNTPFDIAVRGIIGVTKIISSITDSVIKMGSAMIPDKWDQNGNPIHYKQIVVSQAIDNIKSIFNGDKNKKDGLLNILCQVVKNTYDEWFNNSNQNYIGDKVNSVQKGISTIGTLIGNASQIIVDLANLAIPKSFDKDGKGINYTKLEKSHINSAKENAVAIINALLSIPNEINNKIVPNNLDQIVEDTINNIQSIQTVIAAASNTAEEFTKYQDLTNKIFGKNKSIKIDDKFTKKLQDNIDIIRGIYTINEHANEIGQSSIEKITDDLYYFVTTGVNMFDSKSLERFTLLNKSIKEIQTTVNEKNKIDNFKETNEQLSKYVKSINQIDIKKVSTFTQLIRELNLLSGRMKGLDSLTHEIADNLSVVLKELTDSLKESKNVIESAETIQENRHKAITKSINTIKDIMNNPLMVKVSSDTTQSEDDGSSSNNESESIGGKVGAQHSSKVEVDHNPKGTGRKEEKTTGRPSRTPNSTKV